MGRAEDACALMATRQTNCAQAILSTYSEMFGLDRNLALQLAQGFGGGMGHTGKICGAVTGAYMVLGLAQKISGSNPRENVDKTYDLIKEFDNKFLELHSSTSCTELLGYDLSTPEGLAEARNKSIFTTVCPKLVRDAAEILETLLQLKETL
jgi:C_GCAxxG_C_C family probable redox protein